MVKRSAIWKHFKDDGNNNATCHHCKKIYKISGNTSNLKDYLLSKHNVNLDNNNGASTSKRQRTSNSAAANLNNLSEQPSVSKQAGGTFIQKRITGSFQNISSIKQGGEKHNKITDDIVYMICKDYEPFSIVEREGFQNFLKNHFPLYKVPSRKTLKTHFEKKFEKVSETYKAFLKQSSNFTLTTDLWADTMNSRSFLGITAHFEHKYELCSINLEVYQMPIQHTAVNIKKKLLEACHEWEIPVDKITALVTDNGSNVVLAADLFIGKKCHLPCFAHTLNLVAITDSIKSVNGLTDLIEKVKSIVTFFRESNNASDQLRTQTDLKLIQDVLTRWNSTFLQRFLQLKQIVSTVLLNYPKGPSMLTAAEIEIMSEVTEVLRPLESVTRDMSGEKYVTASKVIPMIRLMTRQYERLNTYEECSTQLKNAIVREFKQRW